MDLFSASLHQHTVPLCFKAATIIHVPKKTKVKALNDHCPLALTSVVVTVLERLTVLTHLKYVTNSKMDPLQFAYSRTWCLRTYTHIDTMQTTHIVSPTGTTDARMMMAHHFVMQHLESPDIYAHKYNANYIILYRRLPFRVQHGHPTETLWQAASAITWRVDVLLDSWLSSALASWILELPRDLSFPRFCAPCS